MSRGLTEQFTQLLFDNDLISGARNQDNGSTSVYAHYPNGSKLRVYSATTNLICLELEVNGKTAETRINVTDALEYVRRWSLDLDNGGVFVNSMDEAYSAARDLLDGLSDLEGMDTSAVDVKKFTAYITYPRVGNYTVHGLLVKLPAAPSHLQEIVRACTYEN